jgi:hypothetical protein
MLLNVPMDLFQCETSFAVSTKGFDGFIHVPVTKSDKPMDLYRYIPMPFKAGTDVFLSIHPEKTILAITQDKKDFMILTAEDLVECQKRGSMYLCENNNIIYHAEQYEAQSESDPDLCLYYLFIQKYDRIKQACTTKISKPRDMVRQIGPTDFVVIARKPRQGTLQCLRKRSSTFTIHESSRITVPRDCTAFIGTHSFTSLADIKTDRIAVIYPWVGSPADLLQEVPISQVEDYVRARRQIAFPPKTEQEIMQEISASPTIMSHAHTNVLLLLLTGLAINVAIIVCVYLCIRRCRKLKEAELKRLNAPPDLFPLRFQPIIREEPRGLLRSQLLTSSAPSGNYFQEGSKL